MARVINTQPGARRRRGLVKEMALALRHAGETGADEAAQRDLFAFLVMTLKEIVESVDETGSAWEKRGYWVKADRFKLEWEWVQSGLESLEKALLAGDLGACAAAAIRLVPRVGGVKPPRKAASNPAWLGAWRVWSSSLG